MVSEEDRIIRELTGLWIHQILKLITAIVVIVMVITEEIEEDMRKAMGLIVQITGVS